MRLAAPHADPLLKVTILPIGMALAVTMQLPEENRHSYSQASLEDSLVVMMGRAGGRADRVSRFSPTGAGNDLEKATDRVRRMVTDGA